MVIVQILGGLGNQLSAYACGYSVAKHLGQELVLDICDYTQKGYVRPYCLDKLQIGSHRKLVYPPVSTTFLNVEDIPKELRDAGLRILKHEDYKTRDTLLTAAKGAKDIYLMGYGGLHYCTQEDKTEIKEQFQLKSPSVAVKQFKERIRQEFSVAVHIRRTDFLILGTQAPVAYYQAAITYVKIFHPDAHFYFFSDDINYVKEQFGPCTNYHYVHLLGGMDADLEEFFCISACNARILTKQSTFSFWATELSQSKTQLNICQEYENPDETSCNQIYLNQAAIDTLSGLYQVEDKAAEQAAFSSSVNDAIFALISEERNDEAIHMIDQVSLDSYGLSDTDTRELTTFKAIALAQKGEAGLPTALRTFYMQMQREHENPVFHANYFRALYQSGYVEESAIHAALAERFGDQENYQPYFEQMDPFVQKLYQLLKNSPVRHFIFFPLDHWNYYITYIKSMAVLLARMGQKVSFFQPPADGIAEGNVGDDVVAKEILKRAEPADELYQYHIDAIPNCPYQRDGKTYFLFDELVRQCISQSDLPAIVVSSDFRIFYRSKVEGVKYVVPDIYDPLNQERYILENSSVQVGVYAAYMATHSDAIFLSGPAFASGREMFGQKVHQAFPAWEGPSYQILDIETDFTPNYISSVEMIKNAAALLEI